MSERFLTLSSHTISQLGELEVSRGFDEKLAEQIVTASQQQAIRQMAPRDATERFSDIPTAMEWFHRSPDRLFYSLGYRGTHLAGVVWFTPTPFHEADYTFAVRVYEPFAGNGLGTSFAQVALDDLEQGYTGSTWADVSVDNIPSQRLAQKIGYRQVDDTVSPDPTRMQLLRPGTSEREV